MLGKDALMTYELYEYQKNLLNQKGYEGMKYVLEEIEMPLIPILSDMNWDGVNINMQMLKQLELKYRAKLEEAKVKVDAELSKYDEDVKEYRRKHYNAKIDFPVKVSSPVQLGILFYDIIGYKTKSGKGTGNGELQEINSPLTNALIEYRKMEKLIDAFLVALPKQIEKTDGKIHTSLNQNGAGTGRFSSSNPNLQQIPSRGEAKEIRRIFGASKGNILMSSDFSRVGCLI